MKRPVTRGVAFTATSAFILAAAYCAAVPKTFGQAAPAAPAPAAAAADEEVIELDPFKVTANDENAGYAVKDTLAGSRIRTELKDVGSAISVVNSQFLQDTGARNNQDLLVYTTGTEVGGIGGNFSNLGNGSVLDDTSARMNPNAQTRVRGLVAADNTRDFFLTDIPWDSFNVGRVDLQRGPNAILFGIGSPAGIVNSSVNTASWKDSGTVESRFGSYGSVRGSLDYNKVLLKDELAIRISALDDNTKYRQDPAFNHDRRIYGAVRFDPKFLRFEGARTQFRANYERGVIKANRPRITPPGDLITPWWTVPELAAIRLQGGLNPLTIGISDAATLAKLHGQGDEGAGERGNNSAYTSKMIGAFGRNYGGLVNVVSNPNTGQGSLMLMETPKQVTSVITSIPWTIMSGVLSMKDLAVYRKNPDGSDYYANKAFYKDASLQDSSIFDFYNQLIDGPNKKEWSDHTAYNLALTQTFFNNRVGFEAVYDRQQVERGQVNMASEFGQAITLDMNNHLVDGSVNPNYGRAVISSDQYANYSFTSDREAMRANAFADFRFSDIMGKGTLTNILGRHVFSLMASRDTNETENRGWIRSAADAAYGSEVIADPGLRNRAINTLTYLNSAKYSNLATQNSFSGIELQRIKAEQNAVSGTVNLFDPTWTQTAYSKADAASVVWTDQYGNASTQNLNPANYAGFAGPNRYITVYNSEENQNRDLMTTSADKSRDEINSFAANWQGFFWDGVFVPSVGIRKDWAKSFKKTAPKISGNDTSDLSSPDYVLPSTVPTVDGRSTSWSFVLHTPKFIKEKLPLNSGLSLFYNRSSNFRPSAGRIDVIGNAVGAPQGQTKDYGFMIETLNDKLTFKMNWYETRVTNDDLGGDINGAYMLGYGEAWAYGFARNNLQRVAGGGWADFTKGYDPAGIIGIDTPAGGWTDAQKLYANQVGDAICNAYFANQPIGKDGTAASFYSLWGIDTAAADKGGFIWANIPAGHTVTGDTLSKGLEFELTGQPTKNWNISINASKQTAERTNMCGALVNWVENRWAVYNTPVKDSAGNNIIVYDTKNAAGQLVGRNAVIGDVRFWDGGFNNNETLRGKFLREYMSKYWLYRMQEGGNAPELRKWRFNFVTNYNFDSGVLKGFNVGGGIRWQDKSVIGYAIKPKAAADDPLAYDLSKPYYGPKETNVDAWVGYQRQVTNKINWRIQLNLRNITTKKELIPVTTQPDGSIAVARISDPFTWTLTNTLSF